jgi:predicted Zn-dependent peptidase
MRHFARLLGVAVFLAAARAPAESKTPRAPRPSWTVERFTLENGLRVVFAPDESLPSVAISVVYDVGSRDEERGRTGFAHLFEHMMFQGSANVPRGEHMRLVTAHGGVLNGTTSADRTAYFEVLPRSELALGLWLEADRMKALDVTPANFENQRAVVKEELRMRVLNQPYASAELRLQDLVYQGYFPYEHSEAGTMRDLDAARFEWVKTFHDAHYVPADAVLAVAGGFDAKEARALVERFFRPIPNRPATPFVAPPVPEATQPREAIDADPHAALPAVMDGWLVPESRHPEHAALDVGARVLCDGESSRLVRTLVHERALASSVSCGLPGRRGPDAFLANAKLASAGAKNLDALEKALDAEIARLAKDGPTDAELARVRARVVAEALLALEAPQARAERLAEFEIFEGDARRVFDEPDRLLAVSKEDVRHAIARWLTRERRARVEVRPETQPAPAASKP